MTQAMPWVFATLAALSLGGVVVAFWQSVRAALGLADVSQARGEDEREGDLDLLARKEALLEGLRDLDFDHEAGKLSDEDHLAERERLRSEIKDVLRAIDDAVGPYRGAAEALVAQAEAAASLPTPTEAALDLAANAAPETPAQAADPDRDRHICPSCGTQNDPDASFCKRCATKLPTEVAV